MRLKKKLISAILATSMFFSVSQSCVTAFAAEYDSINVSANEEYVYSGYCGKVTDEYPNGENMSFDFDETNGTLTISGNGNMKSYAKNGSPWYNYRNLINTITITITEDKSYLPAYAFYDLENLTEVNILSENIISGLKFIECTNIRNIVLCSNLNSSNVFSNCQNIDSVTIPNNVTKIVYNAFRNTNCFTVKGARSSYAEAFAMNPKNYNGTEHYNFDSTGYEENVYEGDCSYKDGSSVKYRFTDHTLTISGNGIMKSFLSTTESNWNNYENIIETVVIEPGVTNIATYAFYGCKNMKRIYIGKDVNIMNHSGIFGECTSLRYIYYYPENSVDIKSTVFQHCNDLKYIYFGKNVQSIDKDIFTNSTLCDVVGFEGSYAEKIADENNLNFHKIGDLNNNGNLDISDVTELQKYIVSLSSLEDLKTMAGDEDFEEVKNMICDVNCDGYVDIKDATAIQKILVGIPLD